MEYTVSSVAPIVLFPLSAFVINAFLGRKLPRQGDWVSVLGIFLSFVYCLGIFKDFIFANHAAQYYIHKTFNWIDLSSAQQVFKIDLGIYIDNLSAVMLLMVSGVATLIHLFSTFYMHGDEKYGKFFTYLSLFTSAMLGLVLSDNLLSIFIFWEIMGFCSYSLIGFYVEKEAAGNASMKAFMTTRVGDVCFLLAILALWSVVGSVGIVDIYQALSAGKFAGLTVLGIPLITFTALCLFMGTIGKSAQFPLQVWLPDAMMGPTPCSALIHAATMVAAGVYLSLRMYPVLLAGEITTLVAVIGVITAFGAATMAMVQTDIKAVLAYSTISQLGYMVTGVGVGAYNAAFMHLITHAVFKACLFLAAGSVIHSLHDHHSHSHVQEMPRMGGLYKKLPYTYISMMACTFAIAGIPFFSGYVSKDRILGDALVWAAVHPNKWVWIVPILGFITALLTAFYMFRMMFLTFHGEPRDHDVYEHCHEEHISFNRNIPLLILAVFTLGVFYCGSLTGQKIVTMPSRGFVEWFQVLIKDPTENLEQFATYSQEEWGQQDTRPMQEMSPSYYEEHHGESELDHIKHRMHIFGAIFSIFIALAGVSIAYLMYVKKSLDPNIWVKRLSGWYRLTREKYYFDHFYINVLIQKGLLRMNRALAFFDLAIYDRFVIDGMETVNRWGYVLANKVDNLFVDKVVDGTGLTVKFFNVVLRTIQSGKIQFYFVILIFVLAGYIWTIV